MRIQKVLVDLLTIKRQDEDVQFYVPDVSQAPVKKLVAVFHATNGRPVFIDQEQLRRFNYGNS
jgi:enhancing lycopene biosynthesis protein 2